MASEVASLSVFVPPVTSLTSAPSSFMRRTFIDWRRMSDRVVELVGAGMAEVLALEMDMRPAEMLAQAVRRVQRRRPSDEGMAVTGELELKLGVRFGFMPYVLQLL